LTIRGKSILFIDDYQCAARFMNADEGLMDHLDNVQLKDNNTQYKMIAPILFFASV